MFVVWRDTHKGRIRVCPEGSPPDSETYHKETYADDRVQALRYIEDQYTILVASYASFWVDEAEKYDSVAPS